MFTGLVEEMGLVKRLKRGAGSVEIVIGAERIFGDLKLGDSVAVNGVCLTVTSIDGTHFSADVMNETLRRSALGSLRIGDRVNLERAMAAGGRFGGHIVSGHIDGIGTVLEWKRETIAVWYTIGAEERILRYIVEKGSIAVDGISLTVAEVGKGWFRVSVIPHTAKCTALRERNTGDLVNLENDLLGKYVERFLLKRQESFSGGPSRTTDNGGLTMDFLTQSGF